MRWQSHKRADKIVSRRPTCACLVAVLGMFPSAEDLAASRVREAGSQVKRPSGTTKDKDLTGERQM